MLKYLNMLPAECDIRVGTSGWYYDHWIGRFYPEKLPRNKWLGYYAEHFDTVELNNTFYRQPKDTTVKNWRKQAPKDFLYAVKANRFITHIKRLKEAAEPLDTFLENSFLLKDKLGPVLFQLPPSFHKDLDLLEGFLKLVPKKLKAVFEFRHKSWFADDAYVLLRKHNAGFCIHDLSGVPTPRVVTADFIYLRFHGVGGRYSGNYPDSMLKDGADWLAQYKKKVRGIYAYFNNDINAYAVKNAQKLRDFLV